jgi:alpha-D-ribose 1-methylphosphonate 5-phosphate C-P lyase
MSQNKMKNANEIELVAVKIYEPINLKGKISGFWQANAKLKLHYLPDISCVRLSGELVQKTPICKDEVCLLIPSANIPEMVVKA